MWLREEDTFFKKQIRLQILRMNLKITGAWQKQLYSFFFWDKNRSDSLRNEGNEETELLEEISLIRILNKSVEFPDNQ